MTLMTKLGLRTLVASCLIAAGGAAHAQLNVLVTGVGSTQFPIAVRQILPTKQVPLSDQHDRAPGSATQRQVHDISTRAPRPCRNRFSGPRRLESQGRGCVRRGQRKRSVPTVNMKSASNCTTPSKQESLGGARARQPRERVADERAQGADYIYGKLMGGRGVFATRLSYVIKTGNRYQLQISDSDGQDAHIALSSPEPIISPAWSPDGTKVAYVSFEKRSRSSISTTCPPAGGSSYRIRRAITVRRRGRRMAARLRSRCRGPATRRSSRSMRTAAVCGA